MQISERGKAMPSSPIRKLVPFAEAAKRLGKKVYHLNIGQPDIETPKVVRDAIHQLDLRVLEYSHSAGNESYRRKLSDYYKSVGIYVEYDEIMVTAGGSEALLFAMMTCLNPGDEVISPEPFYANYNGFAQTAGVVIKPVTASIETGFALPPVAEIERAIGPKTRAIIICNPNNPTGYLYKKEELLALEEVVRKHSLYLFSDEVYREFCYDGNEPFSAMNLSSIRDQVVMIDSVSKRYSMCGARIGTLITHNRAVYNTAMKYAQARLSPPSLGQVAAEAAIQTPDAYFKEVSDEYVKRRNLVVDRINQIPGALCPTPGGAFYAIARLPIDDSDRFCQWLLEEFSYNNSTVMLAPATGFYATAGLGKNEVRIGYVLNLDDLSGAMDCLEKAVEVYPGRV
ncbi:MAG: pyridoxal phosphate-dependent aminotransferase [Bacteroidia bacterium]|nr:pyridoxal phosphate-dependent aminotransferase [Bacteroidia bacterium]